jgi:PKD repeat protein
MDLAGARWVEIEPYQRIVTSPSGPPCPRDEYALIYDAYNGLYWSFGGSGYTCASQSGTIGAGSTTTQIIDPALPATVVDYYKDYSISIQGNNTYYSRIAAYDPATKTLTLATAVPAVVPGRTFKLTSQPGGGAWSYEPPLRKWRGLDTPSTGYTGAKPKTRLSPSFAYSPVDNAAIMFGGVTYNDTWALDAITQSWVQMLADGAPGSPSRRAQITNSMVYDSANDVLVLFGGRCADMNGCNGTPYSQALNDTWIYRISTNSWTRMLPANSPAARAQHTLSFDAAQGVVLLFGGVSSSNVAYNDTWVYSVVANTWTQVSAANPPPARYLHAAVYDPGIGQHVIYGGNKAGGATTGEVWTFSLSTGGGNISPSASFTINPASGSTQTSFAFNGAASVDPDGTIASYAWTFGDGATGTGATTTHVFASPGTYSVTLTVTDNMGATGSASSQVTVSSSLVVSIAYTQKVTGTVSGGGTVTSVKANGTPIAFNTGAGGAFDFTLSAAGPTTFSVQVTATAGSDQVTQTFTIVVP